MGTRTDHHPFAAADTPSLHPGDQGTVQRLLGHKSLRTTMATYTGAEIRAAIRRYDEVVLGLRAQALSRAGVAA